jgi:sensor histidine kinase YesM
VAKAINGTDDFFQTAGNGRNQLNEKDTARSLSQNNDNRQLDSLVNAKLYKNNRKGKRFKKGKPPITYVFFLLVFTIGTSVSLTQQWLKTEQTKKNIETEKLSTELSFLKTQINPHFFFNTLNNIYSLAIIQSDKTATAVLKLSSIMRYILTETKTDHVPLENEVSFLKNFIDLQLVRLTDKVTVHFEADNINPATQVAPLLFIAFVENAFKYGVSTKEPTSIHISLSNTHNTIRFTVQNNIVKTENALHETTGIGINNVKRRLDLLYPGKHNLQVTDTGEVFTVLLEIVTT